MFMNKHYFYEKVDFFYFKADLRQKKHLIFYVRCQILIRECSFPDSVSPVLLEQTEEGSTCILALCCSPCPTNAISRLVVISEARNMEIYNQTEEYCGTARGERVNLVLPDM